MDKVTWQSSMNTTTSFIITGRERIHCEGCEQRISNALRRLPGVTAVEARARTQSVAVTFDPGEIDEHQLRARLSQLGYETMAAGGGA